jgi:acyl-CoA synthetase (NDP forming)
MRADTRGRAIDDLAAARAAGRTALDEPAGKRVLGAFGIAVPEGETVADADAAVAAFRRLGGPVAVKMVSPDGVHKSDVGGVRLGVRDEAGVREAVAALAAAAATHRVATTGWLVERMASPGTEVVIGGLVDERFGPVVMLGLGGVFVEIFADTSFRVCPIDADDARDMIDELVAAPLLRGARGRAPVDEAALVDALLAVGGADGLMMRAADSIAEVDVNPLIVSAGGALACDARIVLRHADRASGERGQGGQGGQAGDADRVARVAEVQTPASGGADATGAADRDAALVERFRPLFEPRTIAVVGASASGFTPANDFIRHCRTLGFAGRIVPIHPKADVVEGLPAVRTLAEVGEPIDYVYVAVGAAQVPDLIAGARGIARYAQIISSGFGEIAGGVELERRLAQAGREAGVRLLGPNCLGLYSPRGGLAFVGDCPAEVGHVGVVSQSGGLAVDMILRGRTRGLRFSGLVTLGNSIDLSPADLVEYYLADPGTRAIGLYMEDVKDGRRFFEALRAARGRKPVVMLLGGQTDQGRQAAASHTGSLASPAALWAGLARQTGAIVTDTLEQYLDVLLAFQSLEPRTDRATSRCVLFGNGGGTSVLAADAFARRGLVVQPMARAAIDALDALGLPPGTSVVNPIDAPAFTMKQEEGRIAESILEIVYRHASPDAVVVHLNLPVFVKSNDRRADFLGNLTAAAMRVRERHPGRSHFVLVLRSDGSDACETRKREFREAARAVGVPVFDEMSNAADALSAVATYERFAAARRG